MNNSLLRRLTSYIVPAISFCLYTGSGQAADAVVDDLSPKIFQVTTAETRPNDAVLVRGEYLDKITEIKVYRLNDDNVDTELPGYVPMPLEDGLLDHNGTDRRMKYATTGNGQSVDLIQQGNQSVKFIIPKALEEGVYSVEITGEKKHKSNFYVNVPKVNWVISEEGLKVTAGDYLRILGKNLLRSGGKGQVALIPVGKRQVVKVKVATYYDDFSVSVNVPGNLTPGEYHLYYHNGLGGKTAWSEPLRVTVVNKSADWWGTSVFNVKDYGAKGDGVHNETAAFRAALNAAEQKGSGIVYVPRGRYMLTGELILSPNVILKGEAKEVTQLFWNPLNWDTNEMPASLISETHHFGVKDLNIWASRAWGVILTTGPLNEQGNVVLENILLRQSAQVSGMLYQVKPNRDVVDAELHSRWSKTGIVLRGENLKIRNCIFNSSGMYTFYAATGFIQNCRFERNTTGVNQPYMLVHPKGLIYEDCYKQGDGYGYASSIDESRNLYEARNSIPLTIPMTGNV